MQNYQELKLSLDMPYQKRKGLYESVINTIGLANQKKGNYENVIPEANKQIKEFLEKVDDYQKRLIKFEEERCE
jgi:hypothetical protein